MKIVVGTDLSERAENALRWAAQLVEERIERGKDAKLCVVHVVEPRYPQAADVTMPSASKSNEEAALQEIRDWIDQSLETAPDHRVRVEEGTPRKKLNEVVADEEADWLAISMTGRGAFRRVIPGSTALGLSHRPPCKMALCHHDGMSYSDLDSVCVGVDFSQHTERAVQLATDLHDATSALPHFVHVTMPPPPTVWPEASLGAYGEAETIADRVERAEQNLDELVRESGGKALFDNSIRKVLQGYPSKELVKYAVDEDIGAMVMSSKGRSAVGDFFMGSVAHGFIKNSPCHVLLTPSDS